MEVKVGDVVSGTWGYSMTLFSAYRVEKVTPKQVVLRELEIDRGVGEPWHLPCWPSNRPMNDRPTVRIKNDNEKYLYIRDKRLLLSKYVPGTIEYENHMD